MKVRFRQTGGFAGLSFGADLDTAIMPAAEAAELTTLVEKSRVRTLAAKGPEGARDLAGYEIEIEEAGSTIRVSFDDMSVPREIEPLLDFLRERARPRPLVP
jgi:hypothetical protein